MKQEDINTDIFAAITLHQHLLRELTAALLATHKDKGELFMSQFMDGLRCRMRVPDDSAHDSGVDPLELQKSALYQAERFFGSVRTILSQH